MQRRIAQGDTTRDRARSGTLARPAARGSCPGEGSGRHGGRVYVEEEGGEVDCLLRRRRPSSCTAAPSPVRPGRRRRGSEACGAGGWRRCCSCSLGRGRTMSPDRFAQDRRRRVTPRCVRRCGGGQRSGDTGRDATLDTDSGWWLRALFALGTLGGCIEWETEVSGRLVVGMCCQMIGLISVFLFIFILYENGMVQQFSSSHHLKLRLAEHPKLISAESSRSSGKQFV